MLFHVLENGDVACDLCSHRCQISSSGYGICGVRSNHDGQLKTEVYGEVIAAHVDPIEKKPLFHFLPGSQSFSVATIGCNFRCSFCQNWQISQSSKQKKADFGGRKITPDKIVGAAKQQGCRSISYTYTEPTVFFEYAFDTARLAVAAGLSNVFVSNGYMTPEALEVILPYLHACNVDLKSFQDRFYRDICGARLAPVLETIRNMREAGIWVEVTTLIVTGQNDTDKELTAIAEFIADVDPNIPWHISRFHPDYIFLETEATPLSVLQRAYEIGRTCGLHYIYIGNVWGEAESTHCPGCGRTVIERTGFRITSNRLLQGQCPDCREVIAGVFESG